MEPESYSLLRFLRAKRSVDQRARNRRVWHTFIDGLADRGLSQPQDLKILELAGGIGSTAARILDSLSTRGSFGIEYTLVDINGDLTAAAEDSLREWSPSVRVMTDDAFRVLHETPASTYDAVVVQAWLDLVNVETALERIFRVLSDGSLFYAPIHFDGVTRFLPVDDEALEEKILEVYHQSMDERETQHGPAGGRRTGSRLLTDVPGAGGRIEAAGASDWIVRPDTGGYPNDEAYFLYHILRFVENEITEAGSVSDVQDWVEKRRAQIDAGTLRYVAHQLDVLATVCP